MRRVRGSRHGLAEIVGTLMLVVIVVAAATAFSFFVAAYQKQLQAEETLSHNKSLEDLRILALMPNVTTDSLQIELASLDVNSITIDGMTLNGNTIVNYSVVSSSGTILDGPLCLNGNPLVASNASCVLDLPAESHAFLSVDFNPSDKGYAFAPGTTFLLNESDLLEFALFTSLGNEFVQSFVPPVALAEVTFVGSFPILDGSNSYQPSGGTTQNVTIDLWHWNVTAPKGSNDTGNFTGQEVELPADLTSRVQYVIWLNVTSSESLVGSTHIDYSLY